MDEKKAVKYLFAIINGERKHISEVESRDIGLCPLCNGQLRAYKGQKNRAHWRHVGLEECDPWHEGKTPWHMGWQDKFDRTWQEVPMRNETERHFADVRTPAGIVVEFQHSPMDPETRKIRENFYGNMIWVIDGDAKKRTLDRFQKEQKGRVEQLPKTRVLLAREVESCLPAEWCESDKPVLFDFRIVPWLIALLPQRTSDGRRVMNIIGRDELVARLKDGRPLFAYRASRPQPLARFVPRPRRFIPHDKYVALKKAGMLFR